jgi:hypothetical protein
MVSEIVNPTFAQTAEQAGGRVIYELSRLRDFDDRPWLLALLVVGATLLAGLIWYLYRRDTRELSRPAGVMLALLRFVALAGLVFYFLGIERRTTRTVVHNSQVVILIDVSQSMGLSATGSAEGGAKSRLDEVVSALAESSLVADLRRSHDVTLMRFDRDVEPLGTISQQPDSQPQPQQISLAGAPATGTGQPPLGAALLSADSLTTSLQPRGPQTRLGQALDDVLRRYRESPLAGVIVITDGAQNSGIEPSAAAADARAAGVPFFPIGVGSAERQRNVAVRDLVLPTRAFPDDTLDVTGYIQSSGYAGQWIDVELHRRRAGESAGPSTPLAAQRAALVEDDEIVAVTFQLEPGEPGTFIYQLRVNSPADDANPRDNQRDAEVEVVDQKTRVLLVASGPMRDYQFLRNQLHRDNSMQVDVLLQSAKPGISQDAQRILDDFPQTREELYPYDCIVAFDPDWTALDASQVALLESWLADEAGGLIVVAGPIQTAQWVRSAEHVKLRDIYPVVFQRRSGLMDDGQYSGSTSWPLAFERAGREAKFLWLANSVEESTALWVRFPGVYGYYDVKEEKPGATVYARFSDPQAAGVDGRRPVYMAGHFYGAGQVFYIGSGELWRLRSADPAHFEVLYTKLIRHVSQGRILRGSSRGALMIERDRYELGESVILRARLADAQHNPLVAESVTAHVLRPDGVSEPVRLAADVDRSGMFVGQLAVLQEGTFQVALSLPGGDVEPLSRFLQVRVPDLERTRAERNDDLLTELARETGGAYYASLADAIHGESPLQPVAKAIRSQAEVEEISGTPDQWFAEKQMRWLLVVVAGALCLEWILRRLNRLA